MTARPMPTDSTDCTTKLKMWLESLNYKLRYSFIHFIPSVKTKHLLGVGTISGTEDKSVMRTM